ncbi:hypothetical protein UFOVP209_30 [uncultured Caudovirales phage]|uniref:Uncharacterized protein n=1 Tax=uncultured Caudovirales phage TaxID=2100421 RepID=A0A6J7WRE5_9CAUD|nr:hypothetical protein UFOVP209_30 [uncultured Caudovirales phage]
MTVRSTPIFVEGNSHPGEETRLMLAGMLGSVTGSFAGGVSAADSAHGVVNLTDLAVTQNGTPNMSVNVATGGAFIRGTQSANQGAYHLWNDASLNVTIAASDPTNPRRDLVIAQVRDAYYSGTTRDARITVVTGTAAASPTDPSLSAFPNALVLARIAVAANANQVVTANITDLRPVANLSDRLPSFSTLGAANIAIPSPSDGQAYYLNSGTATEGPQYWHGSAYRLPWNMPWGHVTEVVQASDSTALATNTWGAYLTWSGTGVVANRLYRARTNFYWVPGAVGQLDFGIGAASGSPTRPFAQYAYANTAPVCSGQEITFTTTAGAMTRLLTIRMTTGGGTVVLKQGSSLIIEDMGPAGAPA